MLTLIKKTEYRKNHKNKLYQYALFECSYCKQIVERYFSAIYQDSCGCKKNKADRASKSRLYKIYNGMKSRCYNPKNSAYKYYGKKNITICDEWLNSFVCFKNWSLANGYKDNLTINRKYSLGNYEPDNCEWLSKGANTRLATTRQAKYLSPNYIIEKTDLYKVLRIPKYLNSYAKKLVKEKDNRYSFVWDIDRIRIHLFYDNHVLFSNDY